MFRIAQKGPLKYLESPDLDGCDFLIHAFCTRQGGVSKGHFASLNVSIREGDDADKVHQNFEMIASAFGFTAKQFLLVNQVHQDGIWVIDRPDPLSGDDPPPAFDALVTNQPGTALCIKTADCVPIFLVDPVRRIIGAIHAGWKGTALKIAEKTTDTFVRCFESSPRDILAFLGPAIGPCCYEVDEHVFKTMADHPQQKSFFYQARNRERWMLDLPLANKLQFLNKGILPEHILSADLCTSCREDLFFSHRREAGQTGRQLNFIMLCKTAAEGIS